MTPELPRYEIPAPILFTYTAASHDLAIRCGPALIYRSGVLVRLEAAVNPATGSQLAHLTAPPRRLGDSHLQVTVKQGASNFTAVPAHACPELNDRYRNRLASYYWIDDRAMEHDLTVEFEYDKFGIERQSMTIARADLDAARSRVEYIYSGGDNGR